MGKGDYMVRRINKTAATQKQEETMVPTKDDEGFYYRGQHVELKEYMRVIDFGKADVFFDPLELYCVEFLAKCLTEPDPEDPYIEEEYYDVIKLHFKNGNTIEFENHTGTAYNVTPLYRDSADKEEFKIFYSELLTAFNIYKQIKQ